MWRDILLVVGVIIAVLAWSGVTPKQIVRLTRERVTLYKVLVSIAVIVTLGGLYTIVFSLLYLRPIGYSVAAMILYFCFVAWQPIIDNHFPSRVVLRKTLSLIVRFGAIPVVAIVFITWDAPVWRKIVPILVGFLAGFAAATIERYIRRRRAIGRKN